MILGILDAVLRLPASRLSSFVFSLSRRLMIAATSARHRGLFDDAVPSIKARRDDELRSRSESDLVDSSRVPPPSPGLAVSRSATREEVNYRPRRFRAAAANTDLSSFLLLLLIIIIFYFIFFFILIRYGNARSRTQIKCTWITVVRKHAVTLNPFVNATRGH